MPTVAELRAAGLTHIRLECHSAIVAVPWQLLPQAKPDMEFDTVAMRLRCRHCGARPDPLTIRPWGQFLANGFQAIFPGNAL